MAPPLTVVQRIPARLQPAHRDDLLVTPITGLLGRLSPGTRLAATETVVSPEGEPLEAVLQWEVPLEDAEGVVAALLDLEGGLPTGTTVEIHGKAVACGELAGVALYLNGTDLPDEVYAASGLQEVVTTLQEALGRVGQLWSYWQGPAETGLYFYGPDGAAIRDVLAAQASVVPLLESSRLVDL